MATLPYNATVEARTRAARFIRDDADLLAQFLEHGGLAEDLDAIIERGQAAAAANLAQSQASGLAKGATRVLLATFEDVQAEYKRVMAIVCAAQLDLVEAGASPEITAPLARIIADETAVHIKVTTDPDGNERRRALKKRSQDAIRQEIETDAAALLALQAGAPQLAERFTARRLTETRLAALAAAARALDGKTTKRLVTKAERKLATQAETEAVRAQRQRWGASYRLLAQIDDARVRALLREAAAKD